MCRPREKKKKISPGRKIQVGGEGMHCMERCLNCPFIFLKGNCKEAGSPTDQRCTREPGPVLLIQSSSKYTHRNRQKQPCAAEEMYIFKNDYVEG